jgi:hypothetical protein
MGAALPRRPSSLECSHDSEPVDYVTLNLGTLLGSLFCYWTVEELSWYGASTEVLVQRSPYPSSQLGIANF